MSFTLDEYDPHRVINWTVHAYDSENDEYDQFDMIIGENIMHELGMKIDYHMDIITGDGGTRPMRAVNIEKHNLQLTRRTSSLRNLKKGVNSSRRSVSFCVNTRKNTKGTTRN